MEIQLTPAAAIRYLTDKAKSSSTRVFKMYGAIHVQLDQPSKTIEWAFIPENNTVLRYDVPKDLDEVGCIINEYDWNGNLIQIDMR